MTIQALAEMTGGIRFVMDARAPHGSSIFRKHQPDTRLLPPFRHPSGETPATSARLAPPAEMLGRATRALTR